MFKTGIIGAGALLVLAGAAVLATRTSGPSARPADSQPASALNPYGFPKIGQCASIRLDDPTGEAARNIAKGDLRPFTVYGFTPDNVPGIFCPGGNYPADRRGGTFVSDMPDACGSMTFSNAPPDRMEAYNRVLGADPRFQKITGCRPSTVCEERYRKGYVSADARDPGCPGEPMILARAAENSSVEALAQALRDFSDRSPRSRDAKTAALIAAVARAKWHNAELLLRVGADPNGRAYDKYPDGRTWLESPLATIFNQNVDVASQLDRASWLLAHGGNFSNPASQQALTWAAYGNRVDAVRFLLARGASPNGAVSRKALDECAQGAIELAGSHCGVSPFYTALGQARMPYGRDTPAERVEADNRHRLARINAVILFRAGARFFAGIGYDNLRGPPDIKATSILLAAAHREGRLNEVIARMLEAAQRDGFSREQQAFITYLRAVAACPVIKPAASDDWIKLCETGAT